MPLTTIERLKIFKKEIGPQEIDIFTLCYGLALEKGVDFLQNYKDSAFEVDQNDVLVRPDAKNYVNKMRNLIQSLQGADSRLKQNFTRIAIVRVGEDFTFNQVSNANDQQWQTHIGDRMIRIMEIFSGCLRSEVIQYTQAPANGS